MKSLIGFILAAPLWFALLIIVNSLYIKFVSYYGPEIRVGYWAGVAVAGFAVAICIQWSS